jgi:DNA repair protein RadD
MAPEILDGQTLDAAAQIIARRLEASDLKSVLKEIDDAGRGDKGVERIVAEAENQGRLLRTRIEDARLAHLLVDIEGLDVLANRRLRYCLALRATDDELDRLHDFEGAARARGTSAESLARCVAERKWVPGKRWARHFVAVLGFPSGLIGMPTSSARPDLEDISPHVPLPALEEFQEDLRAQTVALLGAGPGYNRAILTLPTGAGKTRTTVEALIDWWLDHNDADLILWIAQSDELCEQAVQAFKEVWIDRGDRGIRETLRVYRFWGGKRTLPEEGERAIIVSTIDKLRSAVESESEDRQQALIRLVPSLGVVIIDEAHRAEAPSYRRVLLSLGVDFTGEAKSPLPIIGLTATPLRSQHDETVRLARRFNNRLLRPRNLPTDPAAALDMLRDRKVLSRPVHRVLPSVGRPFQLTQAQEAYFEAWKEFPPELLVQLGEEKDRNKQILETIAALDASWPVLFFGCSVQHAEAMAVLLRRRGRHAAAVTADTREATRRHLIQAFRTGAIQVLCNFGVLTTGFDAPCVRAVVVGRPTSSRVLYDQMLGRGMRGSRFGGTDECLVIDVDANVSHRDGTRLTTASQQYAEYWARTEG